MSYCCLLQMGEFLLLIIILQCVAATEIVFVWGPMNNNFTRPTGLIKTEGQKDTNDLTVHQASRTTTIQPSSSTEPFSGSYEVENYPNTTVNRITTEVAMNLYEISSDVPPRGVTDSDIPPYIQNVLRRLFGLAMVKSNPSAEENDTSATKAQNFGSTISPLDDSFQTHHSASPEKDQSHIVEVIQKPPTKEAPRLTNKDTSPVYATVEDVLRTRQFIGSNQDHTEETNQVQPVTTIQPISASQHKPVPVTHPISTRQRKPVPVIHPISTRQRKPVPVIQPIYASQHKPVPVIQPIYVRPGAPKTVKVQSLTDRTQTTKREMTMPLRVDESVKLPQSQTVQNIQTSYAHPHQTNFGFRESLPFPNPYSSYPYFPVYNYGHYSQVPFYDYRFRPPVYYYPRTPPQYVNRFSEYEDIAAADLLSSSSMAWLPFMNDMFDTFG